MRAQKNVPEQKADRGLPPDPTPPRSSGRLYAATWTMLGMLSLGYIGVLLLQPDWAAPLTTQSLRTEEPAPDPSEVVARLTGEVDSLRQTVAGLREELTEVRSKAAAREVEIINQQARAAIDPPSAALERETRRTRLQQEPRQEPEEIETATEGAADSLALRPTRTEPPPEPAVQPEPPPLVRQATAIHALPADGAPEIKTTDPETRAETRRAEPAEGDRDVARRMPEQPKPALHPIPPRPVKKVVVLDVKPVNRPVAESAVTIASPVERRTLRMATGSLPATEPVEITFGAPTVTPASEAFAIRLDAAPSLDALRLRWSVLNDRYRDTLDGLEPRYLESGSLAAPSYELLAGPVASVEEASRICAQLQARRVPCSVGGPFGGDAL